PPIHRVLFPLSPGLRPGSVARACGPARVFLVPDSCGSACIVAPRAAARVGSRVLAFGIAGVRSQRGAGGAKPVNAEISHISGRKPLWVRVPSPAPPLARDY